ncbi:MAG: HAD hydrolase family protein [Candidatus Schekmanbacteria bacterium]|nr:HAD hydrolase family protein [Candidatus Schekmanbacteria bacterium]
MRLILSDIDGVLTTGHLAQFPDGAITKTFHVADGLAVKLAHRAGIGVGWITGRSDPASAQRAHELGVSPFLAGIQDKGEAFTEVAAALSLDSSQIAYIGDDLPDLPALRRAGFAVTVATAGQDLRKAADWVARTPPGCGVLREVVELVLRSQGRWADALVPYLPGRDPAE